MMGVTRTIMKQFVLGSAAIESQDCLGVGGKG